MAHSYTQPFDGAIITIADYLFSPPIFTEEAYQTARLALADALGCAMIALKYPSCTKMLGPFVPGLVMSNGSKVPGTSFVLDPIAAAFNLGTMIRWLDYNDTWLAAEWGHPSDNLGAILSLAYYLDKKNGGLFSLKQVLDYMIQAYEIQGILALENSFNQVGLDHVILVKIASAAVAAKMYGASYQQLLEVISNSWIDLGPLRTYRHSPNTGTRKSWAAGDATSRGVYLANLIMRGEMGYPTVLTAKHWGFCDAIFKGQPIRFQRPLGCYVMENILFKVSFPAEFHAQTAVEAAFQLHPHLKGLWDNIHLIELRTHFSAKRIIDKIGVLNNPADRDHCLQYMVAIALIHGELKAEHYEEEASRHPLVDQLRSKMHVIEEPQFSEDYLDPNKRSIANSIKIILNNGHILGPITIEYPLGHRKRREESLPFIFQKFENNLSWKFQKNKVEELVKLFKNEELLFAMSASQLLDYF